MEYILQLARLFLSTIQITTTQGVLDKMSYYSWKSYLLNKEESSECIPTNSNYTLKHIIIDCIDIKHQSINQSINVDEEFNI